MNGALLVDKHAGVSSFGLIEILQRQLSEKYGWKRRDFPKIGHGGTLDPFATGLLVVCVGKAAKLCRYFLESYKSYEGVIRFGETTVPGDPTSPVTETSLIFPSSLDELRTMANRFCAQPYLQVPPMHSAKKRNGKPLYELARAGIEVEREARLCRILSFEALDYDKPKMKFRLTCTSGTYIRTLAQDFSRFLGTVGLLETLQRTASGQFQISEAWSTERIKEAVLLGGSAWPDLPCWVPFDRLLGGFARADATAEEANALSQGRQNVLVHILNRKTQDDGGNSHIAIYERERLVGVAKKSNCGAWEIERIFS